MGALRIILPSLLFLLSAKANGGSDCVQGYQAKCRSIPLAVRQMVSHEVELERLRRRGQVRITTSRPLAEKGRFPYNSMLSWLKLSRACTD
jgi:hypothetical protein